MDVGTHEQLVLLALLAAVAGLLTLVPFLRLPYPILLVVGGLALGFVPGLPHPQLPPELVLVGVLPPLLYSATFFKSRRSSRSRRSRTLSSGSGGRRRSCSERSSRRPTRSLRRRSRAASAFPAES